MEYLPTIAALFVGTLVSEDLTCITAGQLSAAGMMPLWVGVIGCLVGIYIGDLGLWLIGRLAARGAMRSAAKRAVVSRMASAVSPSWKSSMGESDIATLGNAKSRLNGGGVFVLIDLLFQ